MRIIILALTLFLVGCAGTGGFSPWPNPPKNEPQPTYQKSQVSKVTPRIAKVTLADGTTAISEIAYEEETEYRVNATPPPTPKQSLLAIIWSRFWFWIVLFVLALIFVPGFAGLTGMLLGKVRKQTGQIVSGVEKFLNSDAPQEVKEKLLTALRAETDKDTKKLVSDLKHNGS